MGLDQGTWIWGEGHRSGVGDTDLGWEHGSEWGTRTRTRAFRALPEPNSRVRDGGSRAGMKRSHSPGTGDTVLGEGTLIWEGTWIRAGGTVLSGRHGLGEGDMDQSGDTDRGMKGSHSPG